MTFNTPTVTGILQLIIAVAAAAGATHVVTIDPQVSDFLMAIIASLAGVHGVTSGVSQASK